MRGSRAGISSESRAAVQRGSGPRAESDRAAAPKKPQQRDAGDGAAVNEEFLLPFRQFADAADDRDKQRGNECHQPTGAQPRRAQREESGPPGNPPARGLDQQAGGEQETAAGLGEGRDHVPLGQRELPAAERGEADDEDMPREGQREAEACQPAEIHRP